MGETISDAFEAAWAEAEGGDTDSDVGGDDFSGLQGADVAYGDEIAFSEEEGADADDVGSDETVNDEDGTAEGDNVDVFDWKQFGDRKVVVKVGGEEVSVPLAEALSGYMRQADYTRKTQAHAEEVKLAGWAQQLREAIQADPKGTIKYLADQYGVTSGVADETDEFVDPEIKSIRDLVSRQEQEMRWLQSQVQQFEADRILNEVRSEMEQVRAEFSDFDPNVVLPLAAERGLSIRDAYLLNESSKIIESRKQAEKAANEAARVAAQEAAKRQKVGRTPKSSGVAGTAKVQPPKFVDFADMLKWNFDHAENVV